MAGGTPATEALAREGVGFVLHPYAHDPDARNYGDEAAGALGVDPLRIFKTLVVDVGAARPELAVAVVPVAGQLSLKHLAAVLGAKRAAMAEPALVARSTGYVLGGVSPLGQKNPLPTVIDETAQLWDTIYVSAGRRGLQVELSPDDLARAVGARFADIAR
ncbi:Cys-tRNA(Pro) deacylase [Propionicimonas sp.]|uniref:Cys-tRNA(Pro) deacylase n=1 Tax=Propionicimonas sp. TaxID=1955623 RepID=UPI0039E507AF